MNIYVPNYYLNFKCIADKCRHSCCIGWEIDIDSETLDYYSAVEGTMGERLKSAISHDGDPHFKLSEGERCPFLNKSGLCDLISALGEDALCNICTDHPRFKNYYSDSLEIGLGLCCEEAARVILTFTEAFKLILAEGEDKPFFDEGEEYVLNKRKKLIDIMTDRSIPVEKRHLILINEAHDTVLEKSFDCWCDFFLGLERLDPKWTELLMLAKKKNPTPGTVKVAPGHQILMEQLTVYFLFRHLPSAIYDGDISQRIKLGVFASSFIYTLADVLCSEPDKNAPVEHICDVARMFSAEIEYSDENLDKLLCEL